ncbi:MAG: CU044_2847 family protein [Cyanobacteria bacterium P01_C01_bin.120]
MTQLIPIQIDTNTVIYMEPTLEVEAPETTAQQPGSSQELTREDLGRGDKGIVEDAARRAVESFTAMESTIKTYTKRTLNIFTELGLANVDKVQLEFGVNLGGEAGVPYVTKGTAECSLKITVECSFPGDGKDGSVVS